MQEYELDVSKASSLRITLTRGWSCSYALGDFKVDTYAQSKSHTIPEYSSSQEFLESGFAADRMSIADPSTKSPTYYMNGRGFYEGIVFDNNGSPGQVCYNVENVDSLSFTIGHVDNSGGNDAKLTIYLDDKEYDTIDLKSDMDLLTYSIDTSGSSVLHFTISRSWSCSYALGDVSIVISDDEGSVYGDCNNDGSFNVADVVLLQKWLLAVPDTHLENWKAADMCEDNRLDVFDLCMMKQMLTKAK